MQQFTTNNDEIVQELKKKAANYSQLKAEILGKLRGVRNFLDGLDEEFIQSYKTTRAAAESLPILEELERIIERIEK